MTSVSILDCTLRDGGLGLEDANKNGISTVGFSNEQKEEIKLNLTQAGIDIIELGSIEITEKNSEHFCIYKDIESISKVMPAKKNSNQMFAALYRGPDTDIETIPNWNPSLCEVIRVIIRYSELKKSIEFCAALSKKGYKVCIQPMLTMRYSESELEYIIKEANIMGAYAVYFVDSYGYMTSVDIKRLFLFYNSKLHSNIKIGFHAHNNMNLAYSNVLEFVGIAGNREIIVDTCLTGMGQGAGNLQTELFVGYQDNKMYDLIYLLDACEQLTPILNENLWGYSVTRLIPALQKCAYKYAIELRNKYKFSYKDIYRGIQHLNYEERQRYTPNNLKKIIYGASNID